MEQKSKRFVHGGAWQKGVEFRSTIHKELIAGMRVFIAEIIRTIFFQATIITSQNQELITRNQARPDGDRTVVSAVCSRVFAAEYPGN
ncbi:hypothetical protein [Hymenobacter jeollabukensis]|uniref:Uncharacterized protein n=1 Tax=Hymenobacter jeollabukensis TaxID=2025313 RepID=A0A5R8WNR9_9BACT|nr:hypothetical protein [Hymenobacter jeollabukensis]TLM91071.1 hypothetical protein FDY95_15855 [Hymenobacter jeollabukensis]